MSVNGVALMMVLDTKNWWIKIKFMIFLAGLNKELDDVHGHILGTNYYLPSEKFFMKLDEKRFVNR